MTDKELLELAAKAAGYEFAWYCEGPNNPRGTPNVPFANGHRWNPLTDDGDAFRLAVRLGMLVQVDYAKLIENINYEHLEHNYYDRYLANKISSNHEN